MRRKILLAPLIATFLWTACNNSGNNQGSSNEEEETPTALEDFDSTDEPALEPEDSEAEADMGATEEALPWAGKYEGTLPCEDCDGIKVEVTINSDDTYSLYQELLGTDMKGTETGTFTWDEEGGIATLKNEEGRTELYQIGENELIRLDPNGNKVQGEFADQYILKKTESK